MKKSVLRKCADGTALRSHSGEPERAKLDRLSSSKHLRLAMTNPTLTLSHCGAEAKAACRRRRPG